MKFLLTCFLLTIILDGPQKYSFWAACGPRAESLTRWHQRLSGRICALPLPTSSDCQPWPVATSLQSLPLSLYFFSPCQTLLCLSHKYTVMALRAPLDKHGDLLIPRSLTTSADFTVEGDIQGSRNQDLISWRTFPAYYSSVQKSEVCMYMCVCVHQCCPSILQPKC